MTYKEYKQMDKKAFDILGTAGNLLGEAGSTGAIILVAGLASIGGAAGWGAAKMNAHDRQDIDTIQKEYENERLKSDIGYLSAKTLEEYKNLKNKQAPKAARVFA
jgi:urocanate hydratase